MSLTLIVVVTSAAVIRATRAASATGPVPVGDALVDEGDGEESDVADAELAEATVGSVAKDASVVAVALFVA